MSTKTAVTLTQIGTVEILRPRVYPLPGGELADKDTAMVEPGHYPVVRQVEKIFWIMEARKNNHEVESTSLAHISPGMFALSHNDRVSGKPFMLTSMVFAAADFAEFAAEENADPDSALRFTLTES